MVLVGINRTAWGTKLLFESNYQLKNSSWLFIANKLLSVALEPALTKSLLISQKIGYISIQFSYQSSTWLQCQGL